MAQPKIAVVNELVELVQDEFDEDAVDGDRTVLIEKSDDLGKGRDLGVYDYIEFSATSPVEVPYADLTLTSNDVDVAVFVELKSDDEDRRDDLFEELWRIVRDHRKRPDTPGDFDRMFFGTITPLDDETFGAYLYQITINFEARSRI